ncbi:hypothetical protein FRC11_005833 [Ceratobasidium sp. 423]|nr:hypothetical protein FRC11_005833 [Ceratobasidium sp. 423]
MEAPDPALQKHTLPPDDSPELSAGGISSQPQGNLPQNMEEMTITQSSEPDGVIPEPSEPLNKGPLVLPESEDLLGNEQASGFNNNDETGSSFINEDNLDTMVFFDANPAFESNNKSLGDILTRIPLMYRLIDMVYESGSTGQGGLVEKVIIDQESLGRLLNKLMPGSFRSISSIDFKSLDAITIKPKGVYGSRSEIVEFLLDQGILDTDVAHLLSQPGNGETPESLRSGLYLALPPRQGTEENQLGDAFLIYWPEETTWRDDAESTVQRNRVTFMRYLTQLSDQIIALVSKDQAEAFVWDSNSLNLDSSAEDEDGDDDGRMFVFEVQKSEDQEESVTASPGFRVEIPQNIFADKTIELIGGETSVGILASSLQQAKTICKRNEGIQSGMALSKLLSDTRHNISLGELDDAQLQLLIGGLRERYTDKFAVYEMDRITAESERNKKLDADVRNIESQVGRESPQIEQGVRDIWKAYSREFEGYVYAVYGPRSQLKSNLDTSLPGDLPVIESAQLARVCVRRHAFG